MIGGVLPDYVRRWVAGGTYCFTVNLADRRCSLLVDRIAVLRQAVREVRRARPFHIDAWVVLPEHMHCLWTLPNGDVDFSTRMRLIKGAFSRGVESGERRSASRLMQGERGIWQRRFWEHAIRDEADYRAHMDYIHFNPVKHGLVAQAAMWPFSTFQRCLGLGFYPADWGGGGTVAEVGERDGWS